MKQRESAVSPVVGVMLMLAVTIMIAAIVSATAGNFSNTQKKAPSAILDVNIYAAKDYGGYYVPTMTVKHVSGNILQTKDLQIITYYTDPLSGNTSRGSLMGETPVSGNNSWTSSSGPGFVSSMWCGAMYVDDDSAPDTLQTSSKGYMSWFGNASATLKPGDMLVTPAKYCGSPSDGSSVDNPNDNPGMDQLFHNVTLHPGNEVTVKIVHIPSGQILFDKDVVIS